MIKLVRVPLGLEYLLRSFRTLFTKPSYVSFCQMTSAINVCEESKNVVNLHNSWANGYGKSRTAYEYFFNEAKWDEDEMAQSMANMFFNTINIEKGKRLLLIIDDTCEDKKGTKTYGVGKFHTGEGWLWGNNFVTSVLQYKDLFIPHKAKMYIKEEGVKTDDPEFKKKPQIAFDEIIKPLQIPENVNLIVVFDSAYFSADLINDCRSLDHPSHVICPLKCNKLITPEDKSSMQVQEYANKFAKREYKKVTIKVRGNRKTYHVIERIVELEDVGEVKLVISKKGVKDTDPKYYISTDTTLKKREVLKTYENRWNIETAHREGNQKLGFKEYQMRDKKNIERFIQTVFMVWTLLLILELKGEIKPGEKIKPLSERVDEMRCSGFFDLFMEVLKRLGMPLPQEGEGLRSVLRDLGYRV